MLATGVAGIAFPASASSAAQTIPKGAIIRGVLKDYAPDEIGSGATLFQSVKVPPVSQPTIHVPLRPPTTVS